MDEWAGGGNRRSLLFRFVVLMICRRLSEKKQSIHEWQCVQGKGFGGRAVVSHISLKTSEMWGTRVLVLTEKEKDRALMGLRPVLVNPRTLVRTWGTQTELV